MESEVLYNYKCEKCGKPIYYDMKLDKCIKEKCQNTEITFSHKDCNIDWENVAGEVFPKYTTPLIKKIILVQNKIVNFITE